jgi:hypothetical protein
MAENNNRQPDEISLGEEKDARARARVKRNVQRARKGNGLNLFDLFVIFVVLVIVALLILGVRVTDLFGSRTVGRACRVEYQICFSAVDDSFANAIAKGDGLYDADTKSGMGVVLAVEASPSKAPIVSSSTEDQTGELVTLPGRVDITVTVVVDALYVEGTGYTVNGRAIRIGSAYTLRFPGYVGNGVCIHLTEVGNAT